MKIKVIEGEKMKKNKIIMIFIFVLFSVVNVNASCNKYSEEELNYIINNSNPKDLDLSCSKGSIFTQDYLESIEASLKDIMNNEPGISPRYYVDPVLNITPIQQEKSNYCGPANVKMVLQYLNGSSLSQINYANSMGTASNGTGVEQVLNELNKYSPKRYQKVNYISQDTFKSIIDNNIANNKPIILHAQTKSLTKYNGHATGHYLTVRGHSLRLPSITVDNVHYVDSNNQNYGNGSTFGYQYDNFSNVYETISGWRYVIY